ncbi:hypothetical protein B7463_g2113, partial [Scytalidium lignicola]
MDAPLSSPSLSKTHTHSQQPAQSSAHSSSSFSSQDQVMTNPDPQQKAHIGASATLPFLRDFNLVAEAAKRAQMAVMMRDFEGIGL